MRVHTHTLYHKRQRVRDEVGETMARVVDSGQRAVLDTGHATLAARFKQQQRTRASPNASQSWRRLDQWNRLLVMQSASWTEDQGLPEPYPAFAVGLAVKSVRARDGREPVGVNVSAEACSRARVGFG